MIYNRVYKHTLIDKNKQEIEINSTSTSSLEKTIPFFIYEKIGQVYSGDGWFYSIKVDNLFSRVKETKLSHFITRKNITEKIPYFNSVEFIPFGILEQWSIFHFIPPSHTGNKVLCVSMLSTLKSVCKKIGIKNPKSLSDEDIKEICTRLAIKKLCE